MCIPRRPNFAKVIAIACLRFLYIENYAGKSFIRNQELIKIEQHHCRFYVIMEFTAFIMEFAQQLNLMFKSNNLQIILKLTKHKKYIGKIVIELI